MPPRSAWSSPARDGRVSSGNALPALRVAHAEGQVPKSPSQLAVPLAAAFGHEVALEWCIEASNRGWARWGDCRHGKRFWSAPDSIPLPWTGQSESRGHVVRPSILRGRGKGWERCQRWREGHSVVAFCSGLGTCWAGEGFCTLTGSGGSSLWGGSP